jgi:hypothetical protein
MRTTYRVALPCGGGKIWGKGTHIFPSGFSRTAFGRTAGTPGKFFRRLSVFVPFEFGIAVLISLPLDIFRKKR